MNTKLKFLAITAIAAIGCAAGISFASSDNGDKQSALTLINVEALTSGETLPDCDYYCVDDYSSTCVLYFFGGTKYCLNQRPKSH